MYKVMLIDDEDNLHAAIEKLLVQNGYAFCGAEDADCLPMAKHLYAAAKQAGCNVTLTVQKNTRHQFPAQHGRKRHEKAI